tara:strand:- start:197 stop:1915 length:1719 start_codon:yes stop_codon:yes gene_type:complete
MIEFQKIRCKNFGSFGNHFTEIDLNRHRTTLVSGLNGHGKSFALLDSITFALFGKPFRKINIPQLPNSVNEKDCVVEVEFKIGESSYKIHRGLKPKKFEVFKDGELMDVIARSKDYQKMLEEQVLKMNYKSFTQVVILGASSFVPFMQLSAADRRTVIEDILDIQVFSNMNSVLRDKSSAVKNEVNEITRNLSINKERGTGLVNLIKSLEKRSGEQLENLNEEVIVANQTINTAESGITEIDKKISDLLMKISDERTVTDRIQKYAQARMRMNREIKENEKNSRFYTDNKNCPTCHQEITEDSRIEATVKADNVIDTLKTALQELDSMEKKQIERSNEIASVQKSIEELRLDRIAFVTTQKTAKGRLTTIENQKEKLQESEDGDIQDVKAQLDNVMIDREKLMKRKEELLIKRNTFTHAGHMLKDSGIKAKVIRYYLPIINALVNKHLKEMDFYVSFDLDENFNETIKSRHRDNFSYMSFSEGEKMRIDLAILLAWREVSRLKNSANTNLLILDEVFDASLDAIGSDDFLKLLDKLSTQSHIFVISHKADQLVDKFQNQITFQKQGNFSRLV